MRLLVLLFALVFSVPAFAGSGSTAAVTKATSLSAVSAGSNQTGAWIKTGDATHGSAHCTWSGLDGIDGTFTIQISNDGGVSSVTKTGAIITAAAASGSESISLNGIVTELLYRVVWTKNSNTTGTVTCNLAFKG